jgi:HlyD family secretion protein
MAETEGKDLSVLRIDPARKGSMAPKPGRSRRVMVVLAIAIVIVIAAALVARTMANVPEVEVVRVSVTSGGGASGAVVLTAGGYIVAHHTIEVSSKVVGKVAWVGVEKGDKVEKGQVLVRLDDSEYKAQLNQAKANLAALEAKLKELEAGSRPQEIAAAQATAQQAQADFNNAEITLKRTRNLFEQKIASRADLDNAIAQEGMAKARLRNARENYTLVKIGPRIEDINYARAQVAQARASVAYADTMLDATIIRAPVAGTVLERNVETGELVSNMNFGGGTGGVKTSVVTLANLNDLQVELDINETDFPRVIPHQAGTVTADAYPDRQYQGVVAEISPEANRQKGTIQVKVQILKPDHFLRPEMSAHVSFLAPENHQAAHQDTLSIPQDALTQQDGKPAVFVLEGSHVQLRTVVTGQTLSGNRVEVLDGLGPNDRVVVSAPAGLRSGARVKTKGA